MKLATEVGYELTYLYYDHAEWSQETFGSDEERGPLGALKHLEREASEAQFAYKEFARSAADEDTVAANEAKRVFHEELADCLLLLLDASRRAGLGLIELIEEGQKKMEINKTRHWSKPEGDEPAEHVRS